MWGSSRTSSANSLCSKPTRDVHVLLLETINEEAEIGRLWSFLRGRGPFGHKLRLGQVERAAASCRAAFQDRPKLPENGWVEARPP